MEGEFASVIPIDHGKQIRDRRETKTMLDQIKDKIDRLSFLNKEVLYYLKEKQDLLDTEMNKSPDKMNFKLIEALQDEIAELEKQSDFLLDSMVKGMELQDEGRERILKLLNL